VDAKAVVNCKGLRGTPACFRLVRRRRFVDDEMVCNSLSSEFVMEDVQTLPPAELRRKRYEQLSRLLKKWIEEDSPYDTMVMDELRKADDLTIHCQGDETIA
jgi:hypothetical protein